MQAGKMFLIVSLVASTVLTACGGARLTESGATQMTETAQAVSKDALPAQPDADDNTSADAIAVEPTAVGGGYLVCAIDDELRTSLSASVPADRLPVGCSAYDDPTHTTRSRAADLAIRQAKVVYAGKEEPLQFQAISNHPKWQWMSTVPQGYDSYRLELQWEYQGQVDTISIPLANPLPKPAPQPPVNTLTVTASCGFVGMQYRIEGDGIPSRAGLLSGGCNPRLSCDNETLMIDNGQTSIRLPFGSNQQCLDIKARLDALIKVF